VAIVRLFAILREIAGETHVQADGASAGDVVRVLCDRYGPRFTSIAERSTVVMDGEPASLDTPLVGSEELAILPPVSGG